MREEREDAIDVQIIERKGSNLTAAAFGQELEK
jgi:hypothetical protein